MVSKPVYDGGLGFDYKWNMGWMNDMLSYMSLDPLWRPYHHDNITFSFLYAFSEKFLLPISHDEVVYGKGSLINKMPGDYDMKFAGVRVFYSYMMAHPGKKLTFMGSEIGQFDEWQCENEIQWGLLQYEKHQKLNHFFADINKFYRDNSPMHTVDFNWEGFNWIHHDDYNQSVIAFRRIDAEGNDIVVICNFQPMYRENYSIGVPKYGVYSEIFNSDDAQYGGNGITNGTEIKTSENGLHGLDQSITLNLPPMSAIYLKCTAEAENPRVKREAEEAAKAAAKAEKEAAKKAAAKKTTTKKATTKKTAEKAEEKKPAAKKATTKKAAEKKAEEKPAEKKPAAKKTTAKKAETTKTTAKAKKETKSDK